MDYNDDDDGDDDRICLMRCTALIFLFPFDLFGSIIPVFRLFRRFCCSLQHWIRNPAIYLMKMPLQDKTRQISFEKMGKIR